METIKHFLGICGEQHPSVLWLLTGGTTFVYMIKDRIKHLWIKLKTKL